MINLRLYYKKISAEWWWLKCRITLDEWKLIMANLGGVGWHSLPHYSCTNIASIKHHTTALIMLTVKYLPPGGVQQVLLCVDCDPIHHTSGCRANATLIKMLLVYRKNTQGSPRHSYLLQTNCSTYLAKKSLKCKTFLQARIFLKQFTLQFSFMVV